VRGNTFNDVTNAIRVEDDGNVVEGNTFNGDGPDHHAVIVGTPLRTTVLGLPVTGTQLLDNTSNIDGNEDPYRWVTGHAGTVESGNTALGQQAALCQGVEPPRSPFIFVIAVAPAGPGGGPPETTPDLTVPALGVLPPC
jgi:hypothetical protein